MEGPDLLPGRWWGHGDPPLNMLGLFKCKSHKNKSEATLLSGVKAKKCQEKHKFPYPLIILHFVFFSSCIENQSVHKKISFCFSQNNKQQNRCYDHSQGFCIANECVFRHISYIIFFTMKFCHSLPKFKLTKKTRNFFCNASGFTLLQGFFFGLFENNWSFWSFLGGDFQFVFEI